MARTLSPRRRSIGFSILLLVLAGLLAAFGYFMVWVSQIDEAKYSPLGPTHTVGVVSLVVAGLTVVSVLAMWVVDRFSVKHS